MKTLPSRLQHTVIAKIAAKHFGQVKPASLKKLVNATLRRISRLDSSSTFKSALRSIFDSDNIVAYQMEIDNCGYLLKNVKFAAVALVFSGLPKTLAVAKVVKDFKVEKQDAILLETLQRSVWYKNFCTSSKKALDKPWTLQQTEMMMVKIYNDLTTYTNKFVGKKLRFATMSSHLSVEDISADLRIHGIQGFLAQYPAVESDLHAFNVAKRTIHNQGINLIHHFTTARNLQMEKQSDGTFISLKISLDVMFDGNSGLNKITQFTTLDGSSCGEQEVDNEDAMSYTLERMIKNAQPQRRRFLKLVSGQHNKRFSRWLTEAHNIQTENDEAFDGMLRRGTIDRYISLAGEFVGWTPDETKKELQNIRKELAYVKEV